MGICVEPEKSPLGAVYPMKGLTMKKVITFKGVRVGRMKVTPEGNLI